MPISSMLQRVGRVCSGKKEDMTVTVCTEYFNLLYLWRTIGIVPVDLHFVEAGHSYTNLLYFMNAGSYNANTNYIVPESVKTIDFFDNAVGKRDNDDLDDMVFLGKYH